jgi:hypothetical protein
MVNCTRIFFSAGLPVILLLAADRTCAAGGAYFQQQVNTHIDVRLDDVGNRLQAFEEIEYTNRSPDTLRLIYLHLWPNAYRDNRTALAGQFYNQGKNDLLRTDENDRGYIDSLDVRVDGKDVAFSLLPDTPDIGVVTLSEPLLPGKTLILTTPFRVKLPSAFISRLGHQMQAYYITQWYPKPAVYDREGWHAFSYLDQGEFYGEYGRFSVTLTLPANYVVAATGLLTDTAEKAWLAERANDTTAAGEDLGFPASSEATKTLHFVADSVHDFAWFADKRFRVRKGEVHLPSGRTIDTWVYFTQNERPFWEGALAQMDTAIRMYSGLFGEYAWPQASAVDGLQAAGRDMEYPMVTLIGECGDPFTFDITLAHEIGHFWFYGILGSNERRHGWMDEGLANFCETEYVKAQYGSQRMPVYSMSTFGLAELVTRYWKNSHRSVQDIVYRSGASLNIDQSPDLDAAAYSKLNYAADVYYKPALGFDYLRQVLGDSVFRQCMHAYVNAWKFRHPQPEDMQQAFETVTGDPMEWLFRGWLRGHGKADYALRRIRPAGEGSYTVSITNTGGVDAPFFLSGFRQGKEAVRLLCPGFPGDTSVRLSCPGCELFRIDAEEQLPEVYRLNNGRRTTGMLRQVMPLSFRFLGDVEKGSRVPVYFAPVAGWNAYDGWMTGAAFYNLGLCERKVEYLVMPLYGWKSGTLAGGGRLMFNIHPQSSAISRISFGPGISHYSNPAGRSDDEAALAYTRVSFELTADLRQADLRDSRREWITLRGIYTGTDEIRYVSSANGHAPQTRLIDRYFGTADYSVTKARVFSPSALSLSARLGGNFYRLSAEFAKTFSYSQRGKGFAVRLFAGKTGKAFHEPDDGTLDYHLHMSGMRGRQDYLYDGVFFDRSFSSYRQFEPTDGGFKAPTNYGSGDWLVALNLKTVIHPLLPVWLYAGIGTYENAGTSPGVENKWMTETGIELEVIPGILSVYFPVSYSSEIKSEFKTNNLTFKKRIRFEFRMDRLNPFRSLKDQMRYGDY